MSYLEQNLKAVPTGLSKILYINWALALLLTAVASVGFLMLLIELLLDSLVSAIIIS